MNCQTFFILILSGMYIFNYLTSTVLPIEHHVEIPIFTILIYLIIFCITSALFFINLCNIIRPRYIWNMMIDWYMNKHKKSFVLLRKTMDYLIFLDIYYIIDNNKKSYLEVLVQMTSRFFCIYHNKVLTVLFSIIIIFPWIVCSSFFIDVVIYHKLYFFYKTLSLLLFPLIIHYIIYCLHIFKVVNLKALNNTLVINIIPKAEFTPELPLDRYTTVDIYSFYNILATSGSKEFVCRINLSQECKDQLDLDHLVILNVSLELLTEFYELDNFLKKYSELKTLLLPEFNIAKYFLYSYTWAYILYFIFTTHDYHNILITSL